jgi:hypothetical protein
MAPCTSANERHERGMGVLANGLHTSDYQEALHL